MDEWSIGQSAFSICENGDGGHDIDAAAGDAGRGTADDDGGDDDDDGDNDGGDDEDGADGGNVPH